MSEYVLIHDQEKLFKNAKPLVTDLNNLEFNQDFELIKVERKITPEQIRSMYIRQDLDPVQKAMEKGAHYVRKYFNDKNTKKRSIKI